MPDSAGVRKPVQRAEVQERNVAPRTGSGGPSQPGDLSAIFKDTSLGSKAPDFNSFLKKGDERIRMLEQLDRVNGLLHDRWFVATRIRLDGSNLVIPFASEVRITLAVIGGLIFLIGVVGWVLVEDVKMFPAETTDGGEAHH